MKILQISDLHFGMHREELIAPFLQELQTIQPDVVLISGDLTQRATQEQYELFVDFAKKLSGVVLTVPGNHDIPLYPHQFLIRMFCPFNSYKHYVNSDLKVHFESKDARILGVNSVNPYRVKKGRLSPKTMGEIEAYFSKPFDGLSILFFHHNFDRLEGAHKPLENYEELIQYLKVSSVNIVCAGHSHYANVNLIEKNNQKTCVFLHAGSLLCTRSRDNLNSYYLLELNNFSCHLEWRCFKEHSFQIQQQYNMDFSKNFSI